MTNNSIDFNEFIKGRKNLLRLSVAYFMLLAIPLTLIAIYTFSGLGTKAEEKEAALLLDPSPAITVQGNEIRPVTVLLNTRAGDKKTESLPIKAVSFKIKYDPSKLDIVDLSGNPVTSLSLESDQSGDVFYNRSTGFSPGNYQVPENNVVPDEGYISFAFAFVVPDNTTSYCYDTSLDPDTNNPVPGALASFYIRPKTGFGSTQLAFETVGTDPETNLPYPMYAIEETTLSEDPNMLHPDMNGASTSTLTVTEAAAEEPTLSLSANPTSVGVGQNFQVSINLNTAGQDTIGADALLDFNPALIEFVSSTPGSLYADYPAYQTVGDNDNILISGYSIGSNYTGSGVFATITFRAKAAGMAAVNLVFTPGETNDSNILDSPTGQLTDANDILAAVTNTSVTISAGATSTPTPTGTTPVSTATPTPTRTPTPAATLTPTPTLASCTSRPVDINRDGKVDAADLSIVAYCWGSAKLTGLTQEAACINGASRCTSDINDDNLVNAADIQILVSWWGWTW